MMKIFMKFLILLPLLCGACVSSILPDQQVDQPTLEPMADEPSSPNPPSPAEAEQTLKAFFQALNQAEYSQAARLFGGSYDTLQAYNPELDPEDQVALLKAGCEINGLVCLEVRQVISIQNSSPDSYILEVELATTDGSAFVLGPCCGADDDTMPPQSSFLVEVHCQPAGTCLVVNLPPYVP